MDQSLNQLRICTICARGGSKSVKNKNIRELNGRPLIAHSVEHALRTGLFSGVAVSSDSQLILDAAEKAGATWLIERPAPLATDEVDKSPAIVHCAREVERLTGHVFQTFVDLDATAPLRLPQHVSEAVSLLESGDISNVFSVCPSRRNPYFNMVELDASGVPKLCKAMHPVPVRRQDTPLTFDMNASIYVWRRREFYDLEAPVLAPKSRIYVMPEFTAFDLDHEVDFTLISTIYPQLATLVEQHHERESAI